MTMHRKSMVAAATFFLAATGVARADTFEGSASMLEVRDNGNIAFTLNPVAGTRNSQFILNKSWDGAKNLHAALLAAKARGAPVRVVTGGCGPAEPYGGNYNLPVYL